MYKKGMKLALTVAVALLASGCGGGQASQPASISSESQSETTAKEADSKDAVVIKVGHVVSEESSFHFGMEKFQELIAEKTQGRYQIEIYPNSQLGGERDLVEGVQMGTVGMTVVASSVMANFVPTLAAVDLPYLIRDQEHADQVFLGDVGNQFMADIDAAGMKCLTFWEVGFRNFQCNRNQVNSLADIKGMKVRTMENKIHQDIWRNWGADPVPMAFAESYTAMQQGALDAYEAPTLNCYTLNIQDVCKYFSTIEYVYTAAPVVISEEIWNAMSAEDQQIFLEAAMEAGTYEREENRRQEKDAEQKLADAGMEIAHPDKEEFAAACEPIYEKYDAEYGDIIRKIKETGVKSGKE